MSEVKRRLATILATDCVDFSKHMESQEEKTLSSLKECRDHFTTWPEHFDLIYVCCSPHWTPAKFLKYFDQYL